MTEVDHRTYQCGGENIEQLAGELLDPGRVDCRFGCVLGCPNVGTHVISLRVRRYLARGYVAFVPQLVTAPRSGIQTRVLPVHDTSTAGHVARPAVGTFPSAEIVHASPAAVKVGGRLRCRYAMQVPESGAVHIGEVRTKIGFRRSAADSAGVCVPLPARPPTCRSTCRGGCLASARSSAGSRSCSRKSVV